MGSFKWTDCDEASWSEPSEISDYLVRRWKSRGLIRILDVGCGLGRHTVHFARCGFVVSAIDTDCAAVIATRDVVAKAGLSADCHCARADKLPFGDSEFDAVVAFYSIYHGSFESLLRSLADIRRVLRPQGELFCTLAAAGTTSQGEFVIKSSSIEDQVEHYYCGVDDIKHLLRGFTLELGYLVGPIDARASAHYWILVSK